MKQKELAKTLGVTHQHFNAVVKGRSDAGKDLAQKACSMIGGTIDVWMLEKKRKSRKPIVDSYIEAFKKAHRAQP